MKTLDECDKRVCRFFGIELLKIYLFHREIFRFTKIEKKCQITPPYWPAGWPAASSSHHLWNQQIKRSCPSSLKGHLPCTLWPLCCHMSNYSQIFCSGKACNSDIASNKLKIFEKSSFYTFKVYKICVVVYLVPTVVVVYCSPISTSTVLIN